LAILGGEDQQVLFGQVASAATAATANRGGVPPGVPAAAGGE
jgi:hypothetical protein